MVVSVLGFGSVWRRRFGKDLDDPKRFVRAVYYNTTGVSVAGTIRTRPRIVGHVRFNAVGGFNPNAPWRAIHRVFECDEACVWQGQNKILFKRVLTAPRQPDYFLVVVRRSEIGRLRIGDEMWRSRDGLLVSLSESQDQQEGMLLMPAMGWLRSDIGTYVLEPLPAHPWVARLRLSAISPVADHPCAT